MNTSYKLIVAAIGAAVLSGSVLAAPATSGKVKKRGSPPAPVAATGQVNSFGFGDDGDFQAGVSVKGKRFRDNRNGTFTDRLTGIVWLSNLDCFVERDWTGALEFANTLSANSDSCPSLNDGSVAGDWRMPNIKELFSLVDISPDNGLIPSGIPLSGVLDINFTSQYWSSSSFSPVPDQTGWAIDVNFGRPANQEKAEPGVVWPVRVGKH